MEIRVGDTVTYRTFGGEQRTVKVVDLDEKDGRPVFDGRMANGELVWGYDSQVVHVVRGRW